MVNCSEPRHFLWHSPNIQIILALVGGFHLYKNHGKNTLIGKLGLLHEIFLNQIQTKSCFLYRPKNKKF